MNAAHEVVAREYLAQLMRRHGWTGQALDEEVQRLAGLIEREIAAEREACAAVADDILQLRGSHAAELVAAGIRARGTLDDLRK